MNSNSNKIFTCYLPIPCHITIGVDELSAITFICINVQNILIANNKIILLDIVNMMTGYRRMQIRN